MHPLLREGIDRVHEAGVLMHGVLLAVLALVGYGEMGEHALGDYIRQGAGFFYFFYGIIISRELLTHKTDTAHAGVDLDVRLDLYAVLFALARQLAGVVEAVDSLRDISPAEIAAAIGGSVTEDKDRLGDVGAPELEGLVEI